MKPKEIAVVKVLIEAEKDGSTPGLVLSEEAAKDEDREFRRTVFAILDVLAKQSEVVFADFDDLRRRFLR